MSREYHDEEWLLEALGENSIEEIADDCDVTTDTIERWIDKHGIVHEEEQRVEEDDNDSTATAVDTATTAEGESVENRASVTTDDVEQDVVEVSEDDVHDSSQESDTDFPDEIELVGVGVCQNCGREVMLGKHPVEANEHESVCAKCDEYLRGKTTNTKRTIIDNPRVPHWSE
jgi:hypothetical protein